MDRTRLGGVGGMEPGTDFGNFLVRVLVYFGVSLKKVPVGVGYLIRQPCAQVRAAPRWGKPTRGMRAGLLHAPPRGPSGLLVEVPCWRGGCRN